MKSHFLANFLIELPTKGEPLIGSLLALIDPPTKKVVEQVSSWKDPSTSYWSRPFVLT